MGRGLTGARAGEDASVRIWSALARAEMATLAHDWPVVAVEWMAGDTGVLTLGANGAVGKWMRTVRGSPPSRAALRLTCARAWGQNNGRWHWAQILGLGAEAKPGAAPPAGPVGLACSKEQIAIALPDVGVRLWQWSTGAWAALRRAGAGLALTCAGAGRELARAEGDPQEGRDGGAVHPWRGGIAGRDLGRRRVSTLSRADDDVLSRCNSWYSEVPNGTLRACEFFKGSM